MREYTEHGYAETVAKYYNTPKAFRHEVHQNVIDLYAHHQSREDYDVRNFVLAIYCDKFGGYADQFAYLADVAKWEAEEKAFYADTKTVQALMACNH